MRYLVTVFLSLFFALSSFGQGVSEQNPSDPVITLSVDGNSFDVFSQAGSGTTSSPHKVYIPVATTTVNNEDYSFYANRTNLPEFNEGVSTQTITLNLLLNRTFVTGEDVFFVAFEKDNGEYKVNHAETINVDASVTFGFDIVDLCADTESPCNDFDESDSNTREVSFNILVGVGNNTLAENTIITDPSDYTTSVVYEINMSNIINTNEVIINDLFKGDGQLTVDYTASALVKPRSFFAIVGDPVAGICAAAETDSDRSKTLATLNVSFSNLTDLNTTTITGQQKVPDLQNDFCYPVRITNCDLYGFCTTASNQFQNAPESIQTLLEKQACFFFTAGFGEQHYVVDFFQAWRDQVLQKYWLGRKFINWYYSFAPQHTGFILERPWLQTLVRGIAFVLYGVIKYWWVLLFLLLLPVVQFRRKRTV